MPLANTPRGTGGCHGSGEGVLVHRPRSGIGRRFAEGHEARFAGGPALSAQVVPGRWKQEGASPLPARCGEGALDVLRPSRLQDLQLQPQCARGTSRPVHKGGLAEPVRRVPKHGDAAEPRNDLLEQLELLLGQLRGEESEASDVPTRVSEAGYETTPLGECRYDDRYGLRSLAGGAGADVGFPSDELRGKGGDPLGSALRGEVLDDEVLTLHVAELPPALGERAPDTRPLGVRERDIPQDP